MRKIKLSKSEEIELTEREERIYNDAFNKGANLGMLIVVGMFIVGLMIYELFKIYQ